MGRKDFPTKDADAFSNFVQGRALFQAYLGSGRGEELNQARDRFAIAAARDPDFDIAKLYLAVTQTELRESDAAIPTLEELIQRKSYLPEAHVQLAYAHIKRYRDADYAAAEEELSKAVQAARSGKRNDLIDLIGAYRVFLLAVRGGRGTDSPQQKRLYLDEALRLGKELLKHAATEDNAPQERLAVQFEVNNAIGIAFLWLGELFQSEPDSAMWWVQSEKYFRAALDLRPKSVRVLQNIGLLYMVRGDRAHKEPTKALELYGQSKVFIAQSLKLNPFDQYPHFQMALLSIKTGDWATAETSVESGMKQKGAVSPGKWASVKEAIDARDISKVSGIR
jgi:tetratricopeptide (TPR) repeat protein